ncbi:hypothetical protein [Methanobacterium petrolearium]|uniref:hypothetical protein n=1 Tax=Methanobacterium petrolearium TaxID=710190 RepID=UPI001AE8FD0C|nr:hypothetical protein [Methanobacterium petrolearium]MBP1946980.1 hypothetical protein [Methanobacterium petrolearium]BDZ71473.1 hypothetical protein GCM10025861_19900 [Methanobacterium petrolearium]
MADDDIEIQFSESIKETVLLALEKETGIKPEDIESVMFVGAGNVNREDSDHGPYYTVKGIFACHRKGDFNLKKK